MNINLTWDLFILVFFGIIVAYSFIIGQNNTLKIILGTYVSALAADAAGNLFGQYLGKSQPFLKAASNIGIQDQSDAMIFMKVTIFILLVIVFTVRGGISVDLKLAKSVFSRMILTGLFGFLSAGLIISTVLMYVSGLSFIAGGASVGQTSITAFSGQSPFVQQLLTYYNFWFFLPVIAILVREFLAGKE
ncbi:MAG: hypothetical protein AAB551_01655 [Patescibacteria group bacterium]